MQRAISLATALALALALAAPALAQQMGSGGSGGGGGSISGVTAGTGLNGGGTSGNVVLGVQFGTSAGTAAQGSDSRIAGALQQSSNLSDIASAATARTNLGLGTGAVKAASGAGGTVASVSGTITAGDCAKFADTSGTVADAGAACGGGGGGVSSVFGRTGAVTAAAGDYTDALIATTRSGIGDTNYSIAATDHYLTLTTTLTAQRTFSLPALTGVNDGDTVTVADDLSKINGANTLIVAPAGSDLINGVNASITLTQPQGAVTFKADKTAGNWLAATVVMPYTAPSHQFLTSWGAGGFTSAQPAASDVSGLAPSATTDTTNAANIASGTLPAARLPAPAATTLGGVESKDCSAGGQFVQTVNTDGTETCATPSGGGDVSGPGSSTNAYVPQWNGTTGTSLAAGLPVATTGNSTVIETDSGGHVASGVLPSPGASAKGGVESQDCSSSNAGLVQKINTDGTVTCTNLVAVTTQGGTTYALAASDCFSKILFTSASAVTVTLPDSLAVGCEVAIEQNGAGQVTLSAAAGATLVSAHSYTKTYARNSVVGVTVDTNSGGTSAVWDLTGDGA